MFMIFRFYPKLLYRSGLSKIAIVLISVGATIVLISLLGHLGAFFDNYSMVACFICILIIIIILEILSGAVFYVFRSRVRHSNSDIKVKTLTMLLREYKTLFTITISKALVPIIKCCGADGPTDWSSSVGWQNHDAVPDSCCVEKSQGCGQNKDKVYAKGCIAAIRIFLLKNLVWVGAVCIALGVVFGVVVGVCLCIILKRKNYENIR
uniref:Tetraspanin n=1 Tax=Sander lucioperca TaxID=283035 RepID=A0A8C9YPJ0_SANLU